MKALLALAAAALLQAQPSPVARAPADVPQVQPTIVARLPHDRYAFTEGFFFKDGAFWEATGQVGASFIRRTDPATGKVLQQATIPPPYFGEGIAAVGDQIVSLTWQHGTGFRWRARDLKQVGRFRYAGEGWALASDGHTLVMSDGTPVIRVLDPKTLAVTRRITVTLRGRPLDDINELELVDGRILANVWHSRGIVRIDPASGKVTQVIDLAALVAEAKPADPEAVANGIAWDAKRRRLWVTGKYWPTIFQIALPPG